MIKHLRMKRYREFDMRYMELLILILRTSYRLMVYVYDIALV